MLPHGLLAKRPGSLGRDAGDVGPHTRQCPIRERPAEGLLAAVLLEETSSGELAECAFGLVEVLEPEDSLDRLNGCQSVAADKVDDGAAASPTRVHNGTP